MKDISIITLCLTIISIVFEVIRFFGLGIIQTCDWMINFLKIRIENIKQAKSEILTKKDFQEYEEAKFSEQSNENK